MIKIVIYINIYIYNDAETYQHYRRRHVDISIRNITNKVFCCKCCSKKSNQDDDGDAAVADEDEK